MPRVLGGALVFLALVIEILFLQRIFHFAPVHSTDYILAFLAGMVSIAWFELLKLFSRKKHVDLLEEKQHTEE